MESIPEIIGKLEGNLIWKCASGHYHKYGWGGLTSNGCIGGCEHGGGVMYFDYLDVSKLLEITDEKIIAEIKFCKK